MYTDDNQFFVPVSKHVNQVLIVTILTEVVQWVPATIISNSEILCTMFISTVYNYEYWVHTSIEVVIPENLHKVYLVV